MHSLFVLETSMVPGRALVYVLNTLEQVMKNIGAILEAGGTSFDNVLKCTILLTDMSHFAKVDGVYSKCTLS